MLLLEFGMVSPELPPGTPSGFRTECGNVAILVHVPHPNWASQRGAVVVAELCEAQHCSTMVFLPRPNLAKIYSSQQSWQMLLGLVQQEKLTYFFSNFSNLTRSFCRSQT